MAHTAYTTKNSSKLGIGQMELQFLYLNLNTKNTIYIIFFLTTLTSYLTTLVKLIVIHLIFDLFGV